MPAAAERHPPAPDAAALSARLRSGTRAIHTRAERSGIVRDLLGGTITRNGYALYLRNLLPAYRAMERTLEERRGEVVLAGFARSKLYRSAAIEADLSGEDRWRTMPVVAAASAYAALIEAAAREPSGGALVAHAYVRYFGDLSGGQILRRLLARSLDLRESALSVYDFPAIADLDAFKAELREAVDEAGRRLDETAPVVDAALRGFRASIDVSEAVQTLVSVRRNGGPANGSLGR